MRRLRMAEHLSVEEIEKRYRSANEGVERSQWQIIWLLAGGKTSREVEAAMGYSLTPIPNPDPPSSQGSGNLILPDFVACKGRAERKSKSASSGASFHDR